MQSWFQVWKLKNRNNIYNDSKCVTEPTLTHLQLIFISHTFQTNKQNLHTLNQKYCFCFITNFIVQLKHSVLKLVNYHKYHAITVLVKTNQCRPSFEFFSCYSSISLTWQFPPKVIGNGALQFHFETTKFLFMTLMLAYRAQWRLNKLMCPNSMIKKLTGEYVSLIAKEFFTVHRTVQATCLISA